MSLKTTRAKQWLTKRSRKTRQTYPLATVAWYGPTDRLATKASVRLFLDDSYKDGPLKRWFTDVSEIRHDAQVTVEIVDWMKQHGVQSVVMTDGVIGCPHEEGIDYPEGECCPDCPFWANRDRFTGEQAIEEESGFAHDDDDGLVYSTHCQLYDCGDSTLDIQIYRGREPGWILEVVTEEGTSIVWDGLFDSGDEAWSEFRRTLDEEGLSGLLSES